MRRMVLVKQSSERLLKICLLLQFHHRMSLFYYTTHELAKQYMQSGIPSQKRFNGVPLTLRYPYTTKENDVDVFYSKDISDSTQDANVLLVNEVVFVLHLPKRFLQKLTHFEDDDGLCLISSEVLRAMRPPSDFSAVVNGIPWVEGFTLLSPLSILRSYRLIEHNHNTEKTSMKKKSLSLDSHLSFHSMRNSIEGQEEHEDLSA
mmetsp:Transcript_42375/g.54508  ORF Transcript_42375/g.54508 Transcript_42375/m.54508 type:complete len:204 (+) Transcript_42375:71-682(+)